MEWRVPLTDLDYGMDEWEAARVVLESRWLTQGDVTLRFEEAFADHVGVRNAIAVSSATAALHLAYLSLGIGPGDEVIVPSLTFVATANAVCYTGATPIFADIEDETDLSIALDSIKAVISSRTKAITVMHYGGYLCDMPAIYDFAKKHDLALVEDAAHSPGGELAGRNAGAWGDIGCFSFFSNKNLATGEGGMIVTSHDDLADQIRLLRSHGLTSTTWDRHSGHAHSYDVVALGYNYRIDEVRSAIGLAQLQKLSGNNHKRRTIGNIYRSNLERLEHVSIPYGSHAGTSAAHLFPILLDTNFINRKSFMDSMQSQGIQTSIHYPPAHRFSYYRSDLHTSLPITEEVAAREVTLPLYPTISDEQISYVIDAVERELDPAVE